MAKEIEDRFLVEAAAIPTDAVNLNLGRDVSTDCFHVSGVMRLILNLMLRSADVVSRSNYEKITQIGSKWFTFIHFNYIHRRMPVVYYNYI